MTKMIHLSSAALPPVNAMALSQPAIDADGTTPPRTLSDAFAAGLNQQAPDQVPAHLLGRHQYGTPSPQAADLGVIAASSPVVPAHRFADQAPTLHAGALDDLLGTVKGWFGIGPSIPYKVVIEKQNGEVGYELDVTITPQHLRGMIIEDGSDGERFIAMAAALHNMLVSWPKLLMELLGNKISTAERQKLEALMQNKYHQAITDTSPSASEPRSAINSKELPAFGLFSEDLLNFITHRQNEHLATITQLFFGLNSIQRYLFKNPELVHTPEPTPGSKRERLARLLFAYDDLIKKLAIRAATQDN